VQVPSGDVSVSWVCLWWGGAGGSCYPSLLFLVFSLQVVKMMIADWCRETGVPLPAPPKVVSVSLGLEAAATAVQDAAPGQDAASRARALALESQRRQRQMMVQMAGQRGAAPSRRRGRRPGESIAEGQGEGEEEGERGGGTHPRVLAPVLGTAM